MAENLRVYEFELSEAEMKSINDLRQKILGDFMAPLTPFGETEDDA